MIFVYSSTIEGYDVIVTPHVIVLEDSSPKPVDDDSKDANTFFNQ